MASMVTGGRGGGEAHYDGATTDVIIKGQKVMSGEPKGRSYCCGLTLEVFYRTLLADSEPDDQWTSSVAADFQRLWFCKAINSPGPQDAMLEFGVGQKIAHNDALPGDFVQLWRHKRSGHSVIFVAWAQDPEGRRVGLHYWSTQPGTDGINFNTELFAQGADGLIADKLSVTRLQPHIAWDIARFAKACSGN